MSGWAEKDSIFIDAGDVGGDAQAGRSYNRRWWRPAADDAFAVIDVYVYPALVEWVEPEPDPARLVVGVQISYTVCTDLDDPGGTEVTSDMIHASVGAETASLESADQAARQLLETVDPARLGWCDHHRHKVTYQDVQAYCRALSGARFLSGAYGEDWRTRVDRSILDVDHDTRCPLGQLGGMQSFEVAMSALDLSAEDCVRLGFFGDDGIRLPDDVGYLNAHWRRLVAAT
ncbi:hypothetical protein [Streptomyces sp. CBMA29]|uniref:hypothetical protein n=1 Tax=Streptomyces sp. CBMA29 TaxID=1896314 RepID=UPI0016620F1D|nr:hypothetical protein [Streptomyces sp. CBMA29]MBD0733991.1 hypothetical protein [Streptomyces sp. CBMA29]